MDTGALKKFAPAARNQLIHQVRSRVDLVLGEDSAARREHPKAVKDLQAAIAKHGKAQVVEQVAYTWFNRFTALRFMDANGYTPVRVVSPAEGQSRPEILAEAAAGHVEDFVPARTREKVLALLDGRSPSRDPQAEAYRLLLVAACNHWHSVMPFLFERIDDYTELLLPEDLLSPSSLLGQLRAVMTEDACQDVEIIGWLYQFYISEKKDQVFAGLKKNQKITAENIPAATQLFTPHWIVRYLVENSLGRLWLLNRPQSKLAAQMDYYIAPEEPETDFLRIGKPDEIRICDPACGSGHMLTYAFDLLHAIYEEEGYEATEIPGLILKHNLTGIEIDDRAGALAAFALAMKAAAKLGRRRFLRQIGKDGVQPNIVVLRNVSFTDEEMREVAVLVGRDRFTDELRETLGQFEQAKNYGSLIMPKLRDPAEVARVVRLKGFGGDLLLRDVQERVLKVLEMAEALSPKYHVVVANPPYAGGKGLNDDLQAFAKGKYPDSKSDLFSMFMERSLSAVTENGYVGMINLPSWLFLSSFEKLRSNLLSSSKIESLLHMGRGIFGIDWGSTAFTIRKTHRIQGVASFFRLHKRNFQHLYPEDIAKIFQQATRDHGFKFDFDKYRGEEGISEISHSDGATAQRIYYSFAPEKFSRIPGSPIAFWISDELAESFDGSECIGDIAQPRQGLATSDNSRFLRSWHEVSLNTAAFDCVNRDEALRSEKKWFPYNKGGPLRKWYGNNEIFVNWERDGKELLDFAASLYGSPTRTIKNIQHYFKDSITWSAISSSKLSVRRSDAGFVFDTKGQCVFSDDANIKATLLSLLNSTVSFEILKILAPTLDFNSGVIAKIPFRPLNVTAASDGLVAIARSDWDAYETSWDFTTLPLLAPEHRADTLASSYVTLRAHWQGMTDEMQRLEEENNRIFIDAYGLQNELTPEVPIEEITLTCNPAYRYGVKISVEEREKRLLADTMAEFLSYAVGCMFGRYSLDAPGLILANQGEGLADYLARVPEPTLMPDAQNVIPVLDGDWFADDITERFRKFLRLTFGETKFQQNLRFIEDALGKDIRKYFTRDFYADHLKRYKKRPIYWLFASPKGNFQALIYMHRYRPDTVSLVLNDYLREYRNKLEAYRSQQQALSIRAGAPQGEKTRALKEIDRLNRVIQELTEWEREVLYPLATQRIEIDLDDGVKANYPKFGAALKPIPGLKASDE